jgi:hypothetical protein
MSKEEKQEKQSTAEQAINKSRTEGEKINPQIEQRREKHQPRDNA